VTTTRLSHVTDAARGIYLQQCLGLENKIFCFITAVRARSVTYSSVKTERYFDLKNFSVEYRDTQEYVVPKMEISL
jgi:hypothetical protein